MFIFVVSIPWVAELGRLDNVRDSAITERRDNYNQRLDECSHHGTLVILTLCV